MTPRPSWAGGLVLLALGALSVAGVLGVTIRALAGSLLSLPYPK